MRETVHPQKRPQTPGSSALGHAGAELKEQAVSGMLWLAGSRLSAQVIDQIFTIFLVRLLAPRDFGLMAMAGVFTSLLNLFADMGLARAIVQRQYIDDEYLSTAFWGNVFSGFVLCGLALVGSVPIARLFHEPMAGAILAALSVRFIFAGGSATHIALLSRQLRFPALTTRTIGSVMVGGTVGVSLAYGGAGVWSLVGQALATYLSRAVLLWVVTSWRPKLLFSWQKARDLWHFGSRILGARIFTYTVKQFDNLLVGGTLGPAMLGYYAFAYGLFLSPLVDISLIVGRVTLSAFSRLQDDLERLKRGFMVTTTYVSFFAFPALIGFLLVTPDLVSVIFGSKWLPAVPVLRLLLVAGLLQSHTSIWATVFQAKNKPDWLLVLGFVSACTYVPAFFIGLRWGIAGVAGGYLASTVLLVPVQLILVQRLIRFRMREYLATFYPLLAASALMAGIVFVTQVWLTAQGVDAAVRLGASVVVGGVSYLGAVLLIRRELISRLVGILVGLRHSQAAMAEEAV